MTYLETKPKAGEDSVLTNKTNGSLLRGNVTSQSAGGTFIAGTTATEQQTNLQRSKDKPESQSKSRKRHTKTEAKDRGMIATAMEMIQIKLDSLPLADRVQIIAELTRRLAARLYTDGTKLQEQRQKKLDLE